MGWLNYREYLKNPLTHVVRVPRQTRFNQKRRKYFVIGESQLTNPPAQYQQLPSALTAQVCEDEDDKPVSSGDESEDVTFQENLECSHDDREQDVLFKANPMDENETGSTSINTHLTAQEGCFLVFAFILKHRLSNSAAQDLLDLLKFFVPGTDFPSSKYLLQKRLNIDYEVKQYIYYCPKCMALLPENSTCITCDFRSNDTTNFFILFDLKKILEDLLKETEVASNILKNIQSRNERGAEECTFVENIYDGKMYKRLALGEHDLTATMNCDGVPCFKSSKFSIHPFLVSLNELSYSFRRKHTLISALWFGSEKPNIRTYLPPIVNALNELSVTWSHNNNSFRSHIYFPILAADSVARCSLQGINQFNGRYGCPWCLEIGETFWETENSHKWVYSNHTAELRTQEEFLVHLRSFRDQLKTDPGVKSYKGIKEASALLLLKNFDIVSGFVVDYMHTVDLGVTRTLTNAWLNTKYHDRPFYIGKKLDILNSRLKTWKVPQNSDRTIRGLDDRKHWKSSEWRMWMFLAPAILRDILPNAYYSHFMNFVQSIFNLCSTRVYIIDISPTEALIKTFVQGVEGLYGKSFCSFNIHLLTHATKCVEDWGPLWNYSLFHFENFNGILVKYFNASHRIESQISKKVIENIHAVTQGTKMFVNPCALAFYKELISHRKKLDKYAIDSFRCLLLGSSKQCVLNSDEHEMVRELGYLDLILACESFKRAYVNNVHVGTQSGITTKRCTCVIKFKSKFFMVKSILLVTYSKNFKCCFFVCTKLKTNQSVRNVNNLFNVTNDNRIQIIQGNFIENVCCYSKVLSNNIIEQIIALPNTEECE